jgi:glycosyltransferase involved in cell wall biosynthesis
MPLENTFWELGKCSYKLIQYMGCGLPVVASAVGMNNEVIKEGKNGFLVNDENEWIEKLTELVSNKELRIEMGAMGRTTVIEKYSLHNNINILSAVIKDNKVENVVRETIERTVAFE